MCNTYKWCSCWCSSKHWRYHAYVEFDWVQWYSDTSGSLWMFKRDEPPDGNANVATNTSTPFK